jgi:hypothetical protein
MRLVASRVASMKRLVYVPHAEGLKLKLLMYEALSYLKLLVYEALSCLKLFVYEALSYLQLLVCEGLQLP